MLSSFLSFLFRTLAEIEA